MEPINLLTPVKSINYTNTFTTLSFVKEAIDAQTTKCCQEKRVLNATIKDLYLCHATSFFPTDGIIYPRKKFQINLTEKLRDIIEKNISIFRPTVHFSVNSIVSNHNDYRGENKARLIIVEKMQNVLGLSGGYLEDVFCIGKHELSNEASILIPDFMKNDSIIQDKIKTLDTRVKIIYYEGSEEQAFKNFSNERQIDLISPIETDPNLPNILCFYGKNQYVSSQLVMKLANKTFCSHDLTPTAQIENYFTAFSDQAPFLVTSESYEDLAKLIQEYVDGTEIVYKLSESQKAFMRAYKKAILLSIKVILNSNSEATLQKNFEFNEELILKYDSKIDLNRKVEGQRATVAVSKITHLDFTSYNRKGCMTLADAAHLTGLPKIESETLMADLKNKTGFEFILESHADKFYVVLKGVNVPNIYEKIWNAYLKVK